MLEIPALSVASPRSARCHRGRARGDARAPSQAPAPRITACGVTKANTVLIGDEDWQEKLMGEIELARHANLASELDALWARKRKKEHAERLREGLKDPWRDSKGGPLREVILTAHKDWFGQEDAAQPAGAKPQKATIETDDLAVIIAQFDAPARARASRGCADDGGDLVDSGDAGPRQERFEACAVEWLQSRFGAAVVFARADHDEEAYHIHAVIAPWKETTTKRRGTQKMLQPSAHPLLKDYEKAQDDVGTHFSAIGLRRGERRKARWRDAVAAGAAEREVAGEPQTPLPEIPEHVPPAEWRKREDAKLMARKEPGLRTGARGAWAGARPAASVAALPLLLRLQRNRPVVTACPG